MTHRQDVGRDGRDLVARWCALAEQRLQYLTALFESGRWRRYYSERAFLENIQEAKAAVERWRALTRDTAAIEPTIDVAWQLLAWPALQPEPVATAPAYNRPVAAETGFDAPEELSSAAVIDLVALERALQDVPAPPLDVAAIEQRYLALRNAL